jgi:hypothetical protein
MLCSNALTWPQHSLVNELLLRTLITLPLLHYHTIRVYMYTVYTAKQAARALCESARLRHTHGRDCNASC